MAVKPVLIFAYGNSSRGDDALAPLLMKLLQQQNITTACGSPIRFLDDYQMQVEHVIDMLGCERILLIDADQSIDQPYKFYTVHEQLETSYTTHGLSPATLLHTFRKIYHQPGPLTTMLAIRGFDFELGQGLSKQAQIHLDLAGHFLQRILSHNDFTLWDQELM